MTDRGPRRACAVYSPLPPSKSGIADYVAEQLPALARRFDVHLVVEDPEQAEFDVGATGATVHRVRDFEADRALSRLPRVYHVGNNPHHEFVFHAAARTPGIVVLHDFVLHHLITELTLARGDAEAYRRHMQDDLGPLGAELARQREAGAFTDRQQFLTPLNGAVVRRARAVITHSRWARDQLLMRRPDLDATCIPHHFFDGDLPRLSPDRAAARARIGAPADALLFVCVGFVTPPKQVELVIRTLGEIRDRLPDFRLLLVGEARDRPGLERLARQCGVGDRVTLTGRVPLDQFQESILAADVVVNLRYPTAGETSGTLVRALGMGRCCVVFDYASFAEFPDDAVAKVPLDTHDTRALGDVLARLAADPERRAGFEARAREFTRREHDLAACADAYADVIERAYGEIRA
jgi:glycosyltransferase involved in cell wall biosynthesis